MSEIPRSAPSAVEPLHIFANLSSANFSSLLYPKMIACLTEMRTMTEEYSKQILQIQDVQPDTISPLIMEVVSKNPCNNIWGPKLATSSIRLLFSCWGWGGNWTCPLICCYVRHTGNLMKPSAFCTISKLLLGRSELYRLTNLLVSGAFVVAFWDNMSIGVYNDFHCTQNGDCSGSQGKPSSENI